jgi:3-methyl-2-oxobutanoate hydroxymethyltransferase
MRTTVSYFQKQKEMGIPITMLTAYDATSARIAERAGIQTLLVGDSLGMVVQGHQNTLPVTIDHIIYHTQLVIRATEKAFVIADMPFMSYNVSIEQALQNAARCLQEGGAQSVKLEGGERMAETIHRVSQNGIPVLAHVGLTPQSVYSLGGWKVQGKTREGAAQLIADADAVQQAGAYGVVLELVPVELTKLISQRLKIPTIGIGAGPYCDGQVQVFHDILGLFEDFVPKHARQYAQSATTMREAIAAYKADVENRAFPTAENAPSVDQEIIETVYSILGKG